MSTERSWISGVMQQVVAGTILAVGALVFGGVGYVLAKATASLAQYAPLSYYLAALVAAMLGGLLVLIGNSAWRRFWPRTAPSTEERPAIIAPPYDVDLWETVNSNTEILAAFAKDAQGLDTRLGELEKVKGAIVDDYQRMLGLEARFDDALDKLKESIQAQNKTFEDRHFIDERNLKEFRDEVLRSNAQLFLALQAIRARETERFYADIIEEEGASLQAKVISNEPFQGDDWAKWEVHQTRLDSALHHWLELADGWQPSVRAGINDIRPESLTSSDWGDIDDLFQRHGQAIMYKTQIAKFNNWQRLRNHVASAIHVAAFGGPHADEVLETIPGGGPTVERVKEKQNDQQSG